MSREYLGAGEYSLVCEEEDLINAMVEVYTCYFKRAANGDRDSDDPEVNYEVGKNDGAVDAVGAILLKAIGGREFYKLWERTIKWADKGGKE